jgi:hypothetical protein
MLAFLRKVFHWLRQTIPSSIQIIINNKKEENIIINKKKENINNKKE